MIIYINCSTATTNDNQDLILTRLAELADIRQDEYIPDRTSDLQLIYKHKSSTSTSHLQAQLVYHCY